MQNVKETLVNYIKDNKADIDEFLATKVNISDVIDNLTSTHTNKPLSANQGRVLKELIDAIVNGATTVATKGYVDYRVHTIEDGWLPWARGFGENGNEYGGIYGHTIDGIQMK